MAIYLEARNKTRNDIVQAFWEIYAQRDIASITVKDIARRAGVHRSTFYVYFDCIFDVLAAVKQEQLEKLKTVCATFISSERGYAEFLAAMKKLYDENENFLAVLLRQDSDFSSEYRQVMIDKLRGDIGWHTYPAGSKSETIVNSVLDGMIRFFITCLQTRVCTLESAYQFASHSVDKGIAPALEQEFGIKVRDVL